MEVKIIKTEPGGTTIQVEVEDATEELVTAIMKEVDKLCLSDRTTQ